MHVRASIRETVCALALSSYQAGSPAHGCDKNMANGRVVELTSFLPVCVRLSLARARTHTNTHSLSCSLR